jgi:ankyrin repeat protein
MLAAAKGHLDVVKLLLDAELKVADKLGRSALSMAKLRRREDVVGLLIKADAEE